MEKDIEEVRVRIEKNYKAIADIEELINSVSKDCEKLELISICGLLYSELVTGVYSSSKIEQIIANIGRQVEFVRTKKPKENEYLIVMTKAGSIGGHSVIVNNWIVWDKQVKYSLVFIDSLATEVPVFLKTAVEGSGGTIFFLKGDYLTKAQQLLKISQRFSKIILFQHMYDLIPNLAYSHPNWKTPIYMYNHANFKFSFGYEISDVIINLLKYDQQKTCVYRGVQANSSLVLQFPNGGNLVGINKKIVPLKSEIYHKYNLDKDKKLVVSMGDSFKFKSIVGYSFVKFVESLVLEREDVQYIIIGPDVNGKIWNELETTTNGRAKTIGYVKREVANAIISYADLYITSFPMASAGPNIAELYGVPYLLLEVVGRGRENYASNTVESIQDLLDKACQILDGSVTPYLGEYYKKVVGQEDWCKRWHSIADSVTIHKGQRITPQRIVSTEEIVNCQLMQERANQTVKAILEQHELTPLIANKLFEICEKYDLHFMPDNFVIEDWNIQQKRLSMFAYVNKWLQLKLKGISLADYLQSMNIFKVAIYGMGQMGLNLYEELKNTDLSVECFIDRDANRLEAPILIIGTDQIPTQSQCIINTAFLSVEQLRTSYTCLPKNYEILSLFEIIDLEYNKAK